jgi:hypothetical protein
MLKSETIGELAKALATAQGKIQNAKKDSENPFFKSKYADLAAVREACQGPFAENGLAVIQTPKTTITEDATIIGLETLLCHSSGEWVSEELSAIPVKTDPQGIGSCITYLRRYALASFAGVASEDDDGNAASHSNGSQTVNKPRAKAAAAEPTPDEAEITALKQALVGTCKMLNGVGDKPAWGEKRLNEFAMQEYGKKADLLELEPMRELLKKLSNKLDTLKAQAGAKNATPDERTEQERQVKLAKLKKLDPKALEEVTGRLKIEKSLDELTLDQLITVEDEIIPF